ncbi:uncharacterized protein TNCV_3983891 [Trichonephila clavipes]|nr:uncharacterized protein TNCV_3983891 [Trichonephila clavipes]
MENTTSAMPSIIDFHDMGLKTVFTVRTPKGKRLFNDNDPKHTARNVKMWCLFHSKQQLHTPPQSPDINVTEYLWVTLETVVQKTPN